MSWIDVLAFSPEPELAPLFLLVLALVVVIGAFRSHRTHGGRGSHARH